MSYENAPATQLIATHCACCGRPLVDAASVERGVGPECARKYGYSEAHKADPDRALRILLREVAKNPRPTREVYYLAREYWYRRNYAEAARLYEDYLTRGTWSPEVADAWLMLARCRWYQNQGEKARDACLQSLKWNAQNSAACRLMAEMSGPKNAARWREVAATATDADVLWVSRAPDAAPAMVTIPRAQGSCPVRALQDWMRASECSFGPVFRKVDRWGNVEHRRLGADAIRRAEDHDPNLPERRENKHHEGDKQLPKLDIRA